MLQYTDADRQHLIVRQSCMERAVTILIETGHIKEGVEVNEVLKKVQALTDKLDKIIINTNDVPKMQQNLPTS